MDLSIAHIIRISVAQAQLGLNAYNTSNIGLFSYDTPGQDFGSDDYKLYKNPLDVIADFGSSSATSRMATAIFAQQPNILGPGGSLVVMPMEPSEVLVDAIARMVGQAQFFGAMSTQIESEADTLDAAALLQTMNKIGFFVQHDPKEVEPGGILDLLRSGGFDKSRGLFYGADNEMDALVMMASYAGRALSTNFSGTNTASTMHLKDLRGVQPDPLMTETLFDKCEAAGADVYASFKGVPKVYSTQANKYFDQVYNLAWFVGAIEVAGFNHLAQVATKIPQTEEGMAGLKGAYRRICEQAVTNGYSAPGSWNSPVTFGNQEDFLANIEQRGYYIYSAPLSAQALVDREARKAPVAQIAIKEAGAFHSSDVIIYINA